jgi:hypothetical protein
MSYTFFLLKLMYAFIIAENQIPTLEAMKSGDNSANLSPNEKPEASQTMLRKSSLKHHSISSASSFLCTNKETKVEECSVGDNDEITRLRKLQTQTQYENERRLQVIQN